MTALINLKFNIRLIGPKTWNAIEEIFKSLSRVSSKRKLKRQIIYGYDVNCFVKTALAGVPCGRVPGILVMERLCIESVWGL